MINKRETSADQTVDPSGKRSSHSILESEVVHRNKPILTGHAGCTCEEHCELAPPHVPPQDKACTGLN